MKRAAIFIAELLGLAALFAVAYLWVLIADAVLNAQPVTRCWQGSLQQHCVTRTRWGDESFWEQRTEVQQ